MTIHAYTAPGGSFPAYVNLTEAPADVFTLTVRSAGSGGQNVGAIALSRAQLMSLINDASEHLDDDITPVAATACFGAAGTEQQQLRIRAFELALNTTAVRTPRDVIVAANEYHRRIVGEAPMGVSAQPAAGAAHPGYSAMQPHQQRVVDERAELDGKRAKLLAFFDTAIFASLDEAEQSRLRQQMHAMTCYSTILDERIAAFART